VLESFHCAESFKLLKKQNCNILEKLKNTDFKEFRKRVISSILCTDINKHSKLVETLTFKYALEPKQDDEEKTFDLINYLTENSEANKFDIQQDFINFAIHTADVGHPAKEFSVHKKWTSLIYKEFFNQGDLEKKMGLQVSSMCDREKTDISTSVVNFINNYTLPSFKLLNCLLPKIINYVEGIESNISEWRKIINENDEK
jgi:hypothetical protein